MRDTTRPGWDDTFLAMAAVIGKRCTCPLAMKPPANGVGALLVEHLTHRVIGMGYRGSLAGQLHCVDAGCTIMDGDCTRTNHAEMNALLYAREFRGLKILYTTVSPCLNCLRTCITAGVSRVVFSHLHKSNGAQVLLCEQSNVTWVHSKAVP